MRLILLYLAFTLSLPAIRAQSIGSRVVDRKTGQPVIYANVGIPGKSVGTTTDEQGQFRLTIPATYDRDTVYISMLGYEPATVPVSRLRSGTPVVYLDKKQAALKEVTVKYKKPRHHRLGNSTTSRSVVVGFSGNSLMGYEIGTLMSIKRAPTRIDSVRFNISECSYDTVFYRLNVYERTRDTLINILNEPIYVNVTRNNVGQKIVVDLRRYHLVAVHDFVVTLEVVRDLGQGSMFFTGTLIGSATYTRLTSLDKWEKIAMAGAGISAYVTD